MAGEVVYPTTYCKHNESAIDKPDFYQMFNGLLIGSGISNSKIIITYDKVDSGRRKIVEEIQIGKFRDLEQFSSS